MRTVLVALTLGGCQLPEPSDPRPPRCPSEVDLVAPVGAPYAVSGPGAGVPAELRIFAENGTEITRFLAFEHEYRGGVTLAEGDVNGDDIADLVVGMRTGPGRVKVFDGEKLDEVDLSTATFPEEVVLADLYPFGAAATAGVALGLGDLDNDRRADLVVAARSGSGRVRVIGSRELLALSGGAEVDGGDVLTELEPLGSGFDQGLQVAVGDVDCDGDDEIAVMAAAGSPRVAVVDADEDGTLAVAGEFTAFAGSDVDGGTIALGDVDGDNSADIVVGAGPGGPPRLEVYAGLLTATALDGGSPERILGGFAFDEGFTGGVTVAAIESDDGRDDIAVAQTTGGTEIRLVDGTDPTRPASRPTTGAPWGGVETDGKADGAAVLVGRFDPLRVVTDPVASLAVVGAGPLTLPLVGVFDRNGVQRGNFFAFPSTYLGGVDVAAGDLNGDGIDDIVVGASTGTARVLVVDGTRLDDVLPGSGTPAPSALLADFFAFDVSYTGGVDLALGDIDDDGNQDIVIGVASGLAQVRVVDGTRLGDLSGVVDQSTPDAILADLFAFDTNYTGGIHVAAGDLHDDGRDDIVVGSRTGLAAVRVIAGARAGLVGGVVGPGDLFADFLAFDLSDTGGVHLAVGDLTGDGVDDLAVGTGPEALSIVRLYDGFALAGPDGDPDSALLSSVTPFGADFFGGVVVAMSPGLDGFADLGVMAESGDPTLRIYEGLDVIDENGEPDARALLAQFTPLDGVTSPDLAFAAAPPEDGPR